MMTVREMMKKLADVKDLDANIYFREGNLSYEIQGISIMSAGKQIVVLQFEDTHEKTE